MRYQKLLKKELLVKQLIWAVKIIDLAKKIAEIAGKDITFEVKKQSEASKISSLHADISKAEKLLDWSPKTSLEDGLKKVIESYKAKHKI